VDKEATVEGDHVLIYRRRVVVYHRKCPSDADVIVPMEDSVNVV
jgi:hypothetical protein